MQNEINVYIVGVCNLHTLFSEKSGKIKGVSEKAIAEATEWATHLFGRALRF